MVAEDTVARLLVSFEQAALDSSKWDFAWLLSHLPMPPWTKLCPSRRKGDGLRQAALADPAWVATAMAFTNESAKLEESRRKLGKGDGKGKDKDEENP